MKFGVLTFSYKHFEFFKEELEQRGGYSVNLGDNMQTLATRAMYQEMGILESEIISVDRDGLSEYEGEPVVLPLNACLFDFCFPLSPAIIPVFIGFQCSESVVNENRNLLVQHEPIGCRDRATFDLCIHHGIAAYVSGCLTMTFPPREKAPSNGTTFVVYGSGAGKFPHEVLASIPHERLQSLELVFQRKLVHEFPLSKHGQQMAEIHAARLLEDYRDRGSLVITSLHHAATPCIASGIPVVICRLYDDSRFSYLTDILPVHLPGNFSNINWLCEAVRLDSTRDLLKENFTTALSKAIQSLAIA
ncbi:MAG: polysaccharide pyruvyl transferase family protein [Pirellulaceae bacterium]|nr:polysaccharide pyruvyl transferase family protein [Pirellulaceae bacterium]